MIDPRTPVIVGVGQVSWPTAPSPEPIELMADAARLATADAGCPGLLARVESIRVIRVFSRSYPDPAALLAQRITADPAHRALTGTGGNHPQATVSRTAADILRGDLDIALIAGAEAWRTRAGYRKRGEKAPWSMQSAEARPSDVYGDAEEEFFHEAETAAGLADPTQAYAVFETALAADRGWTPDQHQAAIAALWAGFAQVAAHNPHAALRTAPAAAEIGTVGPANRMICYPYPKLMCSNNVVDQGAALLMCSVEAARSLGIPAERWVFPHSGSQAAEPMISERERLGSSPAIRAAGHTALELAGVGVDDVAFIDVYSCFPSAVQVAAAELGLSTDRPLTVTGGLTFAGGPWNNYSTHAIATLVGLLRESPEAYALCTANGGLLTKHAVGVYSGHPPVVGFRSEDARVQPSGRAVAVGYTGDALVEAFTVEYGRDGEPARALVAALTPGGARTWTASKETGLIEDLLAGTAVGSNIRI